MKKTIIYFVLLFTSVLNITTVIAQNATLILKKQRPPGLDMTPYRQVAVGDIVGATGFKTEQSLDFTDALTADLFNAKTLEVVDRAQLESIFSSQRDLQVLDNQAKQILNKKMSNGIFISGRIQRSQLEQKLIYQTQSIVVNGCDKMYHYEVNGNVTVQLKILDLKTGKMIFSDAVTQAVSRQTKEKCEIPEKMDMTVIERDAIKELANETVKLIVPYEQNIPIQFNNPGLFKPTFKQLNNALKLLEANNTDAGLNILKGYTESKDIKDKFQPNAWYNYALGLLYAGRNKEAKAALQKTVSLNPDYASNTAQYIKLIDDEEAIERRMQAMNGARQKAQAEFEQATEKPAAAPQPKKTTTTAKKTKAGK